MAQANLTWARGTLWRLGLEEAVVSLRFYFILWSLVVVSCGGPTTLPSLTEADAQNRRSDNLRVQEYPGGILVLEPGEAHYKQQLLEKMEVARDGIKEDSTLIYISYQGGDVDTAFLQSAGLSCEQSIKLSPSQLTMTDLSEIIAAVKKEFTVDVDIVTTEPKLTTFSTVYLGGLYDELKCENLPVTGALGVKDPGNVLSTDVGFVFEQDKSATISSLKRVIATQIDYENFSFTGSDSLTEVQVQVYTNLHLGVTQLTSKDLVDLQPMEPNLRSLVPGSLFPLPDLNQVTTVIAMAGSDNGALNVGKAKTVLAGIVNSKPVEILSQIASAAGAIDVSVAIELAQLLFGGGERAVEPQIAGLPNYDQFINLNGTSMSALELIRSFDTHIYYLDQNFPDEAGLRSMVVLAFLQKLKQVK